LCAYRPSIPFLGLVVHIALAAAADAAEGEHVLGRLARIQGRETSEPFVTRSEQAGISQSFSRAVFHYLVRTPL